MPELPNYLQLSNDYKKWVLKDPFGDDTKRTSSRLVLFIALILLDTLHPIDIGSSSFFGISFLDSGSPPALREVFFYPTLFFTIQFLIYAIPELIQWNNGLRIIARNEANGELENIKNSIDITREHFSRLASERHDLEVTINKVKLMYKKMLPNIDDDSPLGRPPNTFSIKEIETHFLLLMNQLAETAKILPQNQAAINKFNSRLKAINRRTHVVATWKIFMLLSWQFSLPLAASAFCLYLSQPTF